MTVTAREQHEDALRLEVERLRGLLVTVAPAVVSGVIAIPFPLACLGSVPKEEWMVTYLAVVAEHLRNALWAIAQVSAEKAA